MTSKDIYHVTLVTLLEIIILNLDHQMAAIWHSNSDLKKLFLLLFALDLQVFFCKKKRFDSSKTQIVVFNIAPHCLHRLKKRKMQKYFV